jgi:hypothetical protein
VRIAALVLVGILAGVGTYYYFSGDTKEYILRWRYPANINANSYWWDLQESTNLVNWTTIQTSVGPTDPVVHMGTNTHRFFRLRGRP